MPATSPLALGAAITAPWGVFELLLLVTFAAHLLVMNVALGGTLLALFAPGPERTTARTLARRLPTTVAVTVNLGVPPLLFASVLYGQYLYTAAILSAVTWVSFFVVVMLAYGLLYRFQSRAELAASAWLAALAAALLLTASFIMTNVASLAVRTEAWKPELVFGHGLVLNVADPSFFPRWLHFVVGSLAVAGLFLAVASRRAAARGEASARFRLRLGLAVFTRASLGQVVVGGLFLLTLPEEVRRLFLGGDASATGLLVLGILLAALAVWHGWRQEPVRAAVALVATVCIMVVVRELTRLADLSPQFTPDTLPVSFQVGPWVLFLASFAVVAGATVWIVAAFRRTAGRG